MKKYGIIMPNNIYKELETLNKELDPKNPLNTILEMNKNHLCQLITHNLEELKQMIPYYKRIAQDTSNMEKDQMILEKAFEVCKKTGKK